MTFEFADLGAWGGTRRLLAEFDPERATVRVDVAAYERIRTKLGPRAAGRFVAYAVAHECFHADHPGCSEETAHAFALRETGVERALFESALRA